MAIESNIGIVGIETYLPTEIRRNDAWPAAVVEQWSQRLANLVPRNESSVAVVTEGVRRSLAAISDLRSDPFQGSRERRVMAADQLSSDMEVEAAKAVLAAGRVGPLDLDLLLTHTMVPDYLCVNPASIVHHKLGLRQDVLAFAIDGVCTSFILQMNVASQFIRSGQVRSALLTQSSACTRLMPMEQPLSAWFGDAASAVLTGPVDAGYGLLSVASRTHGELHRGFCASVPGGRWYEGGPVVACNEDRLAARRMQLLGADIAHEVIDEALAKAGIRHRDVAFFASHQPVSWFPSVCQDLCGLGHAKSNNTFAWTGNISSVNLPMQLSVAHKEGLLKRGDVVAMYAMGAGMMSVAAVMRWAY